MRPAQPADVISAGPRRVSSRVVWLTAVVLLAAALTGTIIVAVHYRGEAAAAHRQLRSARAPVPPRPAPPALSTARISGGRPHSQYELFGGDCAGNAANHAWAIAVTDARGSADLAGHAWTVSVSHEYYLVVGTPGLYREHPGPAVRGYFGVARGLSAVRSRVAPCAP